MSKQVLRLLCVAAHPDDEALGFGGTLAKYAAEGVEIYVITATRGEYGWLGDQQDYPGETELGKIREQELYDVKAILRINSLTLLDYIDGRLDQVNPQTIISELAEHIRRIKPHVVITFDPYGAYGHPDHIAISQFTTAAVMQAAYIYSQVEPHQVQKLYYRVDTDKELAVYEAAFGELAMTIDGIKRQAAGWKDWAITTHIDIASHWNTVWQSIMCHQSQLASVLALKKVAGDKPIWKSEGYYRVFSLVNGGRRTETDLFEGLI